MLKDEKRYDFLPKKKWKHLTKKEFNNLKSYQINYGHYKKLTEEIDQLKRLIKESDGIKNKKKVSYFKGGYSKPLIVAIIDLS